MRSNNSVGDGRLVVDRNQAEGPHPHPAHKGEIVPFKTVNQVLLEDGDVVYECDFPNYEECNYINESIHSVVAHQSSHNDQHGEPNYPVQTIKAVIRAAKIAQRDGTKRGYAERAAVALNAQGHKRHDGKQFTAGDVSRLFRVYVDRYPVRILSRPPVPRDTEERVTERRAITGKSDVETRFSAIAGGIEAMAHGLNTLAKEVRKLEADVAARHERSLVDPTLADKAKRWDELQALMNGKSK